VEEEAKKQARRTIDVFEAAGVDTVVINAAGCGSTMKEYGHLLRDDPEYGGRGCTMGAQCRDVAEVLASGGVRAPRHPVRLRVAYHDACHLQHAQRVKVQPREVLATVPGLTVLEVPDAAVCCGSAGIYNLVQPQPARELGERKAEHVLSTGAEALVSSNPGCLLQIQASLEKLGRPLPAFHMVELLDASIRNASLR
jgi:glycolate oxidase iron-sulfur subunit